MLKKSVSFIMCMVLCVGMLPISVTAVEVSPMTNTYADNTVLVILKPGVATMGHEWSPADFSELDLQEVQSLTKEFDNHYILLGGSDDTYRTILELTLSADSTQSIDEVLSILAEDRRIATASPDYYYTPCFVPNDPYYTIEEVSSRQMYQMIGAEQAWDLSRGSKEIRVGVIDSGIAAHEDLIANLTSGYDFQHNNSDTTDDAIGHGTFVSGIIGAAANNGIGIAGMCPNVSLVPLQVSAENGLYSSSAIISAVLYAEANDIAIINCSFISPRYDDALYRAMKMYDGLIVCAAGNDALNLDNDLYAYPASFDLENIISVAASDTADSLTSISNYGASCVDIAAPGANIRSAMPNNTYAVNSGTSIAAAFITGSAALLLSYNPNLTTKQVKDALLSNVDPVEQLQESVLSGGRLNVCQTLQSVLKGNRIQQFAMQIDIPTETPVEQVKLLAEYDSSWLTPYQAHFHNDLTAHAIYDYSVNGELFVVIQPSESATMPSGTVTFLFTTRLNQALSNDDLTATIISLTDSNGEAVNGTVDVTTAVLGDVNNDGVINTTDVRKAYRYISGETTATTKEKLAMDVDRSTPLCLTDAMKIMHHVIGSISVF